MIPIRLTQEILLAGEDDALHALGERTQAFPWVPRQGETIMFSYYEMDTEVPQAKDVTFLVEHVTHEVWRSGEIHLTLTMQPWVADTREEFEQLILAAQKVGFHLSLEAGHAH